MITRPPLLRISTDAPGRASGKARDARDRGKGREAAIRENQTVRIWRRADPAAKGVQAPRENYAIVYRNDVQVSWSHRYSPVTAIPEQRSAYYSGESPGGVHAPHVPYDGMSLQSILG